MLTRVQPVVVVDGFSGPFDLLVRLIERRELSLLAISLAEVTDQYLASLTAANLRDPEHLSAFLVVAAKLLLIKSTLLLPARVRPRTAEEAPPDPTDLTARLRQYATFRQVAETLGRRVDAGWRSYPHSPARYRPEPERAPERLDPSLLARAMRRALERPKPVEQTELPAESRLTVAEAIALLRAALDRLATIQLTDLLGSNGSRQQYVATFLAVLELARLGLASVEQRDRFGAITVSKRSGPTVVDGEDRVVLDDKIDSSAGQL